jgi:glutathione reductase (NADPH)
MEGHVVSSNIIKGNRKKVDYPPMPSVVFTQPTLAAVGLTEAEAKAQDIAYEVNHEQVGDWFNAKRLNTREYAFKTIINKEDQTLLGAHLVGPLVEETINLFALAIKAKMKISDLRTMIFTYPTLSSDVPYMI